MTGELGNRVQQCLLAPAALQSAPVDGGTAAVMTEAERPNTGWRLTSGVNEAA